MLCMYVCMYACMYVCMHACMYITDHTTNKPQQSRCRKHPQLHYKTRKETSWHRCISRHFWVVPPPTLWSLAFRHCTLWYAQDIPRISGTPPSASPVCWSPADLIWSRNHNWNSGCLKLWRIEDHPNWDDTAPFLVFQQASIKAFLVHCKSRW